MDWRTALLLTLGLCGCAEDRPVPIPVGAVLVQNAALDEMSGLTTSGLNPDVLWAINDSGTLGTLYRLGRDGKDLGSVAIDGPWLWDAEALTRWQEGEQTWLLLGDIGDNRRWRGSVMVHAIAEPEPGQTQAAIAWSVRFAYPEGPQDAEAMAVDPRDGHLLILTKASPQSLYRLPLQRRDGALQLARRVHRLPAALLDRPVTDLAISSDGLRLTALTYASLWHWQRDAAESWSQSLQRAPRQQALPPLRKAESMTLLPNQVELIVGSERRPTPLWTTRLPPFQAPADAGQAPLGGALGGTQ